MNETVFFRAAPRVLYTVFAMMVCACMGSFTLNVQAAPATLASSEATVYEQADEESSPIGNLVEGSTFEYIGDVTAEDGSVWHQIITAGGVNGYIKGDREIEAGPEEPVPEGQGEPEETPGESGNQPPDGEEGTAEDTQDENVGEDGELSEENSSVAAAMDMTNSQQKKYVLDSSEKIKKRENFVDLNPDAPKAQSTRAEIDKTLYISIAVVLFCVAVVFICLKRMGVLPFRTAGNKVHKKQKRRNMTRKGKR